MAILQGEKLKYYHPCDTMVDSSGVTWVHGALTWDAETQFIPGKIGSGIEYSGGGSFASISDNASGGYGHLGGANRITTAFWGSGLSYPGTMYAAMIGFSSDGNSDLQCLQIWGLDERLRMWNGNHENGEIKNALTIPTSGWHFYVIDSEWTGSNWTICHSLDGSGWVSDGTISIGAMAGTPTKTVIFLAETTTKIDDVALWKDATLFTSQELTNLYNLGNQYDIGLDQYEQTYGGSITASNNLFILCYGTSSTSGDLFICGHDTTEKSGNFYTLGPQQTTTSGDLFTLGFQQIVVSGDLFIHGHDTIGGSGNSFIYGHGDITATGVFFVIGPRQLTNSSNLFIYGYDDITISSNLFIEGIWLSKTYNDLFISGPQQAINSSNLFLYGHESITDNLAKLYWTDRDTEDIRRCNIDGSNVEILVNGLPEPRDIAIDLDNNKMYWVDSHSDKVQRANLDGSDIEDLITTGLSIPCGIDIDTQNNKIYWTDRGTLKIQRANLDGSNVEDLITVGLSFPHGIVLDINNGKMYWTDQGIDKIQRANLDGSNVEDLVITGLDSPNAIELDLINNKMYWTDYGTNKIQRANLDGSGVEDLVTTGLDTIHGLTLDVEHNKMYWVDNGTDKIQRANLNGSNVEDILTSGLIYPDGIELKSSGPISVSLFVQGFINHIASGNFYIYGHPTISESCNFFIYGHDTPSFYIYGHESATTFCNLFIEGCSELLAQPIDWLLKSSDHYPQIIGTLEDAISVTIQLWEVTDGQNILVSLVSNDCYQISNTGRWAWSTANLPIHSTYQQQYFYVMITNYNNIFTGQFFLEVPERAKWIHPNSRDDYIL